MTQPGVWQAPQFLRTQAEGNLWNALLSYRDQALPTGSGNVRVQFSAAHAPDAEKRRLLIKTDHGPRFFAVIESFPFDQLFGADLEFHEFQQLPKPLCDCLEEGILSMIWQALPQAHPLGSARITASGSFNDIAADIEGQDDIQWLHLMIGGIAPTPISLLIGVSLSDYVHLISRGALAQSGISRSLAGAIAINACFVLGSITMRYADLLQLELGSLIVLQHMPHDQLHVRAGDDRFDLRRNAGQIVCVNRQKIEKHHSIAAHGGQAIMTDNVQTSDDAPAAIEELQVRIDFDIGQQMVSLAAIQNWQPGTAVLIDPPAMSEDMSVTIRANGQIIGTGDLVRIDDRVAVRLTRLTFRDGQGSV